MDSTINLASIEIDLKDSNESNLTQKHLHLTNSQLSQDQNQSIENGNFYLNFGIGATRSIITASMASIKHLRVSSKIHHLITDSFESDMSFINESELNFSDINIDPEKFFTSELNNNLVENELDENSPVSAKMEEINSRYSHTRLMIETNCLKSKEPNH